MAGLARCCLPYTWTIVEQYCRLLPCIVFSYVIEEFTHACVCMCVNIYDLGGVAVSLGFRQKCMCYMEGSMMSGGSTAFGLRGT